MKKYSNQKGLTLVEVIVTLAIISIIASSFLTLFTTGFKGIFTAGNRSKAMYAAQKTMESIIAQGVSNNNTYDITQDGFTIKVTVIDHTLQIQSPSTSVNGKQIHIEVPYRGGTAKVTSFIPNSSSIINR